jgi:proton-dependent oligopeptide transporter, POT family
MNTRADATAPQIRKYQFDRAFLGHPRGLGYLAFSEGWERFSYYGMTALLALYSAQYLFKPGHIGNIWGFAAFRQWLEILFGPLTPLGMGGAIAALYGALVYLTPLLGGFVADRFIGRTYAVIFGAVTMAVGHFCMAFDQTYLVALGCILIGSGFFKGNLAAQVGDLYAPDDSRRADAFQIYVLAISIAVIVSPIVCGFLGQKVAWHFGFGTAGVGMLIGLGTYISGRRWLPAEPRRRPGHITESRPGLIAGEGKRIAVLVMLIPVTACAFVGNQEIFAAYELWADAHYQLVFFHWAMPASFLISLDAIVSTVTLIGVVAFWRWWGVRHREPDEITKITMSTFLASLAPAQPVTWRDARGGDRRENWTRLGAGLPPHQRYRFCEHVSGRAGAVFARRAQGRQFHDDGRLSPLAVSCRNDRYQACDIARQNVRRRLLGHACRHNRRRGRHVSNCSYRCRGAAGAGRRPGSGKWACCSDVGLARPLCVGAKSACHTDERQRAWAG